MKTPTKEQIAKFIEEEAEYALAHQNGGGCSYMPVASGVALVIAWVGGYSEDDVKTNKYVVKDGDCWGLEVSLRIANSSYFVEDWEYLNEGAGSLIGEDYQKEAEWILHQMEVEHYINPRLIFNFPDGTETDLLEDASWMNVRDCKYELTVHWWLYHGWSKGWGHEEALKIYANELAEHYRYEDDDLAEVISEEELAKQIYNRLIEEV